MVLSLTWQGSPVPSRCSFSICGLSLGWDDSFRVSRVGLIKAKFLRPYFECVREVDRNRIILAYTNGFISKTPSTRAGMQIHVPESRFYYAVLTCNLDACYCFQRA